MLLDQSKSSTLRSALAALVLVAIAGNSSAENFCRALAGHWYANASFMTSNTSDPASNHMSDALIWGKIEANCNFELFATNGCVAAGKITRPRLSKNLSGSANATMCTAPGLNRDYNVTVIRRHDGMTLSLDSGTARSGHIDQHSIRGSYTRYVPPNIDSATAAARPKP